tara:strand:+ start:60 stop:494 length:435 start_codon:yes stop_codon:yes gene_type:complete
MISAKMSTFKLNTYTMKKLYYLLIIFIFASCANKVDNARLLGDYYCQIVNSTDESYYTVVDETTPKILDALNQLFLDEVGKSFCDVNSTKDSKALMSVMAVAGSKEINYDKFFGETPNCKIDKEVFMDRILSRELATLCEGKTP